MKHFLFHFPFLKEPLYFSDLTEGLRDNTDFKMWNKNKLVDASLIQMF